ncbi:ras small monomeric GTPase [Penicillium sp. IBT 18751x]|nr:ras small monomeric GTPase [Penicillium sp. IBT 18751x]
MADKISITICGDGGCGTFMQLLYPPVLLCWEHRETVIRCHHSGFLYDRDLIKSGNRQILNHVTAEDSYSVTRTIDGLPYSLSITDTAGQEEYRGLWTASTLKSDAFLLVYDITNPSSLESLNYFMDLINMEAEQRVEDNERLRKELGDKAAGTLVGLPPPVKIVAGNKCDLKDGRAVTSRDGLEYARKNGCGFMETSAREMVNIEETFAHLVRRVVETRRLYYQPAGGGSLRPPSRAGHSVYPGALPPTTADASIGRESRFRTHRFFAFGKGRKLTEIMADGREHRDGQGPIDEVKQVPSTTSRRHLFRRLCCWC